LRGLLLVLSVLSSLALAGCGDHRTGDAVVDSLTQLWELHQQSFDGGRSYRASKVRFQFVLNSDLTWTDRDGGGGSWSADTTRLTIRHAEGNAVEYFNYQVENDGTQLRLQWCDAKGKASGRVSVYRKVKTEFR